MIVLDCEDISNGLVLWLKLACLAVVGSLFLNSLGASSMLVLIVKSGMVFLAKSCISSRLEVPSLKFI